MPFDAISHRRAAMWGPKRKPAQPRSVEFNPAGVLSNSLMFVTLFEAPVASARNYVNPSQAFSLNGSSQTVIGTPYGGSAVSTNGTGSDSISTGAIGTYATGTTWTCSFLGKYDGIGGATYTGDLVPVSNIAVTVGIGINNSTNQFGIFGSTNFSTPLATSLTGWHRVTICTDNVNKFIYLDGVLASQVTGAGGAITADQVVQGWPWPMADFFLWNRCLSAQDIANHNNDPYRTVLRPRLSELGLTQAGLPATLSILQSANTAYPNPWSADFSSDFGPLGLGLQGSVTVGASLALNQTTNNITNTTNPWSADFSSDFGPRGSGLTGTVSAAGTALNVTQSDQTIAASGGPKATGLLAETQGNNTVAAAAGPIAGLRLSLFEVPNTISGAGGTSQHTAALSITQPDNGGVELLFSSEFSSEFGPAPVATATVSMAPVAQASQTVSAAATVLDTAVLSRTQGAQTASASGGVLGVAHLSVTTAGNAIAAVATVVLGGTVGLAQSDQTLSAFANEADVHGSLAETQGANSVSAAAGPVAGGSLSATQAQQIISATGAPRIGASTNLAESANTISAAVNSANGSELTLFQQDESLSASAFTAPTDTSTLAVTQPDQTITAMGGPVSGLVAADTQDEQTITAAGTIRISGALAQSSTNTVSAGAVLPIAGGVLTNQPSEQLVSSAFTQIIGDIASTQQDEALSSAGVVPIEATVLRGQTDHGLFGRGGIQVVNGLVVAQDDQALSSSAGPLVVASVETADPDDELFGQISLIAESGLSAFEQDNSPIGVRGGPVVEGDLSGTQPDNQFVGQVIAPVGAAFSSAQPDETVSADGAAQVSARASVSEAANTLAAGAGAPVAGALSVQQSDNALASRDLLTGSLAATQAPQAVSTTGVASIAASLSIAQDNEILGAGGVRVSGSLAVQQGDNAIGAAGIVSYRADLVLTQQSNTGVALFSSEFSTEFGGSDGPVATAIVSIGGSLTAIQTSQRVSAATRLSHGISLARRVRIAPEVRRYVVPPA